MSDFQPENAVAVTDSDQGMKPADTGSFNIDRATPVSVDNGGNSDWERFSQSNTATEAVDSKSTVGKVGEPSSTKQASEAPLNQNKGQSKTSPEVSTKSSGDGKTSPASHTTVPDPQRPPENWLNATLHSAEGAMWSNFVRPFDKNSADMDQYLGDLEKKHPIASVVGGTAPFIASAAFVPESLVPNIYLRTAAQFGVVGFGAGLNKAKDDPSKQVRDKIQDVASETVKEMSYGPVFAKAQSLQILDRPFRAALARAGVIAGGSGVVSTVYGDNITEAFKQGGMYGALSLITESPHLAKTAIGRGVISHMNDIRSKQAVQAGWPVIDAEGPNVAQEAHDASLAMAKNIKGIDKPQIAAAAVKLPDGTIITGTNHEDALNKIGHSKDTVRELNLPKVTIEDQPGIGEKKVVNDKGETIGAASWSTYEGFAVNIKKEMRRGKVGTSVVDEYFKMGNDNLNGIVGKSNTPAQEFWKNIGGKLKQMSDGNFSLNLSKSDFIKSTRANTFEAGFSVVDPNGDVRFINREESRKDPFNLPNGHSEDVKGLNESKFMPQEDPIKIVNPDTLAMMASQEGKMDINLIPGVTETAEMLSSAHTELKEKFTPAEVGQEGQRTAAIIRENLGVMARSYDKLDAALSHARNMFEKVKKDDALEFIYNMEEGNPQKSKDLQKVADVLRNIMDTKRDEVRGLGTGKLENFIENYFPHVWEQPGKVGAVIKRIMGKRPFQGPASFLKQRTIPTTREGIDLGFTPVTYNPIDSVMLKVREMDRYLMAHRSIQALKNQGLIKFVRTGDKAPEGFVAIDDRFAQVAYKNDAKELVLAGKYMAQKDAGRILNNYLSPGLTGKSYIYDLYRGAGNTLNQFQLGISAFHLGFTSMDATVSKFALGINKLSTGDFAGAIKEFGTAPFAPITNIIQGRDLLQAWYGKDKGPLTNTIAELMASAGGRAKMDKFYATGIADSMKKSIKEGKIATAALKVPFYIVEQVARPIMEYIVPRQKLGVFMDLMKMEIERNPHVSHEQMRTIAQKAWDSVDNRMGQLVYDNLFWNRVTKDLAMASVRSLGWNLGTIREIGGGTKDMIGNVQDMIHGRSSKMSYRSAYVMALPIVTGLYGAVYQYLHTGQGPQELKDYFFPKNGAIDSKGQAARISLPTYMKDIYHYTTNPVQTVLNKFSPVNNTVIEMMLNKDFYGVQIRNADDPVLQQIADESKFVASQFIPFGFRNLNRDTRTNLASKIEPFIGITPAPYDINMTAAEKDAYEIEKGKIPVGSRTKSQADHSKTKAKLRSDFMADKDKTALNEAVESGVISSKEKNQLIKESKMTNLERMTQHLTFEEVMHVMKRASPKEKIELEAIAEKKKLGKQKRGSWTDSDESLYDKTFNTKE